MGFKKKRLSLNKKTISDLQELGSRELAAIVGALPPKSASTCPSVDVNSCPVTPCKKPPPKGP